MTKKILLEICVDSIESARIAEKSGAHRIELCSSLSEGGITPSYGMIRFAVENIKIPVHVIIRPRGGNFQYSDEEFYVMLHDIALVKSIGAAGVVFGILNNDCSIDLERTSQLVEIAKPLSVTFHRAFDFVKNPTVVLKELIKIKIDRVLTSGQKPNVTEGIEMLKELVAVAQGKIIIMPSGGVSEINILKIVTETGVKEIHASARVSVTNKMMDGVVLEYQIAGAERISKMINVLNSIERNQN